MKALFLLLNLLINISPSFANEYTCSENKFICKEENQEFCVDRYNFRTFCNIKGTALPQNEVCSDGRSNGCGGQLTEYCCETKNGKETCRCYKLPW